MDPQDRQGQFIDDILDEAGLANRLFFNARELSDRFSEKSYLDFNIDESLDNHIKIEQIPMPLPLDPDECHSIREELGDDTNHFEDLDDSSDGPQNGVKIRQKGKQEDGESQGEEDRAERQGAEGALDQERLKLIIGYLVENSGVPRGELLLRFERSFPGELENETVLDIVEKFVKLKKTKEELVKYCMRKAFKFILELPKNKHLLEINKEEKFSFSKCKNRFLKKISQEKSMNNKFLQQIFQERGFSEDYRLFLRHFERIMQEDNNKKIRYLAELLSVVREGRAKSVEMVRRLPWTSLILNKVGKISRELLKYASPE